MGACRSSFWGVAVAMMMLTTILISSPCCGASVLIKANATYGSKGEVTAELLIYGDTTRDLMYEGSEAVTGQTDDPNKKACNNGEGNPMGACGGSADNQKHCNQYAGASAC